MMRVVDANKLLESTGKVATRTHHYAGPTYIYSLLCAGK
jgi:hypothetical protein